MSSSSSLSSSGLDEQSNADQQNHEISIPPAQSVAIVFVPRFVAADDNGGINQAALMAAIGQRFGQDDHGIVNVIPRALPGPCIYEEHAFVQGFKREVLKLLRDFRRHFPYRQTVQWTIEYGNERQHTFHIVVKPRNSITNS